MNEAQSEKNLELRIVDALDNFQIPPFSEDFELTNQLRESFQRQISKCFMVSQGADYAEIRGIDWTNNYLEKTLFTMLDALANYREKVREAHNEFKIPGHCPRVMNYSVDIASRLHEQGFMTKAELTALFWAALMHDVGKALDGVFELTEKNGPLTRLEYEQVANGHTIWKNEFLDKVRDYSEVLLSIIQEHHHNYYGISEEDRNSGVNILAYSYPIPSKAAQIIRIADSFDSATTRLGNYGVAHGDFAREIKMKSAAELAQRVFDSSIEGQYNPEFVKLFINLLRDPNSLSYHTFESIKQFDPPKTYERRENGRQTPLTH